MSINLNHEPSNHIDISAPLNALLGLALVEKQRKEYDANRGKADNQVAYKRIGAGYIGTSCARELGYRFHKYPKDPDDGTGYPKDQLARHAAIGHWAEAHTVDVLRAAGFNITNHEVNPDGTPVLGYNGSPKQHGFMSAPNSRGQFQLAGELDGIIHAGPAEFPKGLSGELRDQLDKVLNEISYPCAFEHKKATHKKFLKFAKDGVKKADSKYYAQMQIGMAYTGMMNCLFVMLDVDQCVYYIELVKFDLEDAQRYNDRAVQVLKSEVPEDLPKIAKKADSFLCQFCDFKKTCWAEVLPRARAVCDGTDASLPWNGVPVWGAPTVDTPSTPL